MFRQYRKIEPGEFFVVAADTSTGMSDSSCAQFLSSTKLDVPLVYHSKILATEMTNSIVPVLEKLYDITQVKPVIAYERNNGGVFELDRLAGLNRMGKFEIFHMPMPGSDHAAAGRDDPIAIKLGWDTNTATRPRMLTDLKEAIDKKLLRVYDKPTVSELYSFIIAKTTNSEKAQAERGAHDDLVMSLAIAWQLYQMCKPPVSKTMIANMMSEFPREDQELFDSEGFY